MIWQVGADIAIGIIQLYGDGKIDHALHFRADQIHFDDFAVVFLGQHRVEGHGHILADVDPVDVHFRDLQVDQQASEIIEAKRQRPGLNFVAGLVLYQGDHAGKRSFDPSLDRKSTRLNSSHYS